MASTHEPRETRSLSHWETRAHGVVNTAGRQFVYQWTAPRSPLLRFVFVPLLIVAALLMLVVFVFVFVLALFAAVLAVVAVRLGLLRSRGGRSGLQR